MRVWQWEDFDPPDPDDPWNGNYVPRVKVCPNKRRDSAVAYRLYLHERFAAAEEATCGFMVTPAGRSRGYDGESFFHPHASKRPSRKYMTEELRSWFGDADSSVTTTAGGPLIESFTRWYELSEQAA